MGLSKKYQTKNSQRTSIIGPLKIITYNYGDTVLFVKNVDLTLVTTTYEAYYTDFFMFK
jgi:hypothetical protein